MTQVQLFLMLLFAAFLIGGSNCLHFTTEPCGCIEHNEPNHEQVVAWTVLTNRKHGEKNILFPNWIFNFGKFKCQNLSNGWNWNCIFELNVSIWLSLQLTYAQLYILQFVEFFRSSYKIETKIWSTTSAKKNICKFCKYQFEFGCKKMKWSILIK